MSKKQSGFVEFLLDDVLNEVLDVRARAMFGGYGIYSGEIFFAIVVDDVLYFKAGPGNIGDYEAAGSAPFTYTSKARPTPVKMSYWKVPADVLESPTLIRDWAEKAIREARQPSSKKTRKIDRD